MPPIPENLKTIKVTQLQRQVLALLEEIPPGCTLSRKIMYDRLEFTQNSGLNDVLGKMDPKKRSTADKEKYPSLLSLGLIGLKSLDIDGFIENGYYLTDLGRSTLPHLGPVIPREKRVKEVKN